jgi:hypothetical protein
MSWDRSREQHELAVERTFGLLALLRIVIW